MREEANPKQQKPIYIFELVLLFIVLVSIVSIVLLVLNSFSSIYSIIIGIILLLVLLKVFRFKIELHDSRFDIILFIILLFALLLRIGPYLYVMGGIDHGLYVNMSATYERTGGPFIFDEVRENLTTDLKKYYDRYNNRLKSVREGKMEGVHLRGIFISDIEKSKYVFQFYPLHPIWMSIAAKLFGTDNRVFSLVLLSIISIIAFYLLGLEFSNGRRFPAYSAAFLLAINPLHTYFSKLPVSEIAFLAFTSTGFYYLIKYYRMSLKGEVEPFCLFLSAGLMLCAFFTRISGFMYMPFFYLLLIVTLLFKTEGKSKKQLIIYFFSIFFLYSLSVVYGFNYAWPYSTIVYTKSFLKILGDNWKTILPIIISFMIIVLFPLWLIKDGAIKGFLKKTMLILKKSLPYILFVVILLGFYRAYQFGFSSELLQGQRWENFSNNGLESLWYSTIFVSILYLSPIVFILLLFAANYCRNNQEMLLSYLLLFTIFFWFCCTVIRIVIPYHYNFGRYLVSELIPYTILLISLYVGHLYEKKSFLKVISFFLIGIISIYSLFFTFHQFKVKTAEGADETLKRIKMQIDENDLLLIDLSGFTFYDDIKTPLEYYYDVNVFYIGKSEDIRDLNKSYIDYIDIFVLSQNRVENSFIELVDEISFRKIGFPVTNKFSLKVIKESESGSRNLFLYKVDKKNLGLYYPSCYRTEGFYPNSGWTNGDGKIINLEYRITKKDKYLILASKGWFSKKYDFEKLNLRVYTNGTELKYDHSENYYYYFLLNKSIDEINEIRIVSSTFVPKDEGMNEDSRILGMYVSYVKVE